MTAAERRRINPIEVPGYDFDLRDSLCGFTYESYWEHRIKRKIIELNGASREVAIEALKNVGVPDMVDYQRYLHSLDGTRRAYDWFVEEFADPMDVLRFGKLFVVTGPSGCGKRSLINMCAFHLRLAAGGWIPLREEPLPREEWVHVTAVQVKSNLDHSGQMLDLEQIRASVRAEIVGHLARKPPILKKPQLTELNQVRKDAADAPLFYEYLSSMLEEQGHALAVILPPTDAEVLTATVAAYQQYIRPGIAFFLSSPAEYRKPENFGADCEHLIVEELRPADYAVFYEQRIRCARPHGLFPRVAPEAITKLAGRGNRNIREVQRAFYRLYERVWASRPDEYGPDLTIQSDDVDLEPDDFGPGTSG